MQAVLPRHIFSSLLLSILVSSLLWFSGCHRTPHLTRQQLMDRAEAHLKTGHFQQALSELSQVLAQDPNNIQVHMDLGWVYLYTDRLDKATAEVQLIQKLDPKNQKVYYLKGAIYEKLGQYVDALESYNDALKVDVDNPALHGDIASVFLKLNNPDAALQEYKVASKLAPQNNNYIFGECMAYRQLKLYEESIKTCKIALARTQDQNEQDRIQNVIQTTKLLESIEPSPAPVTTPPAPPTLN